MKKVSLEQLNQMPNTLMEHLGIQITAAEADYLEATMPVDHRTHQPFGLLHGGASVALAETLGSVGSFLRIPDTHAAVGLEINANHIRSMRSGTVTGRAEPVHLGRSTHIWQIHLTDEAGKLVCSSRMTVAIVAKKSAADAG
jgi:1,4-dihydroxy-2-naphthoyl-CoA hydrolase